MKTALADRYAIERELGSGGMAIVYLAHDLRHNRAVAVKVLRREIAAVLGRERFLREIEIAARLQHPHILPLHDSGEADGYLYFVMPYVKGHSLRDKIASDGKLPIGDTQEAIPALIDVARTHRDPFVQRRALFWLGQKDDARAVDLFEEILRSRE